MGKRAVAIGPTGERVAANIRALRERRALTLGGLAERLTKLGRPIVPTGISKIEQGDRRVDADDLVALALALEVTPNRLLLDQGPDDSVVELAPSGLGSPSQDAWKWATGMAAGPDMVGRDITDGILWTRQFGHENRPHDPPVDLPFTRLHEHRDILNEIARAVDQAKEAGLTMREIVHFVRMNIFVGPRERSEEV